MCHLINLVMLSFLVKSVVSVVIIRVTVVLVVVVVDADWGVVALLGLEVQIFLPLAILLPLQLSPLLPVVAILFSLGDSEKISCVVVLVKFELLI